MTLHARNEFNVSAKTAQVACAAFPKGNVYMTMRDELGMRCEDSDFADLFTSTQGRPAASPRDVGVGHGDAIRRRAERPTSGRVGAWAY
jgi:transposase